MEDGAMDRALEAAGVKGLAVYVALAYYQNKQQKFHRWATVSYDNIARRSGFCTRTCKKTVDELEQAGLFSVKRGSKRGSDAATNRYRLLAIGEKAKNKGEKLSQQNTQTSAPDSPTSASEDGLKCTHIRQSLPEGGKETCQEPGAKPRNASPATPCGAGLLAQSPVSEMEQFFNDQLSGNE
jgi:hypothetical protein